MGGEFFSDGTNLSATQFIFAFSVCVNYFYRLILETNDI